ncbi:hypothetical protein DH2020_034691 [Rehmannia glutinosa]|uniref:Wound-responsive family protein n=1 Tax=Rehmannia glutinosa TaxID=99300 RepID=A0ABR0VAW8_REHGL
MGSTSRAWLVAASIGAVEALKDQGFCRWNYGFRVLQQHAKNNFRSYTTQAHKVSGPSSTMVSNKAGSEVMRDGEKNKRTEKSLKKVMDLSCLGPSTVRF